MKKSILIALGFSFISQLSFAETPNGCGPKPTAPKGSCDNLPADKQVDCQHNSEINKVVYEFALDQWNLCAENNHPSELSGYWIKRRVNMCAIGDVPIYGGAYFTGERRSATYNPADYGWYCDEVYVPEVTSQYYYYPDYDGTTCEVYIDQPIRIEKRNICRLEEVQVFIEY